MYADYAEVLAGNPEGATVIALVPTDRAGVTVLDDWDGMGQRATGTGTAIFDDVAVSAEELLQFAPPDADTEPPALYLSGAFFQLYVTALEAGVLQALRSDAVAHVLQRPRSFAWAPTPSAPDDPLLQREIGEIAAAAFAAEATVLAAADALAVAFDADVAGTDPGLDVAHEASRQAAAAKIVIDGWPRSRRRRSSTSAAPRWCARRTCWTGTGATSAHWPRTTPRHTRRRLGAYYVRQTRLPGCGYF